MTSRIFAFAFLLAVSFIACLRTPPQTNYFTIEEDIKIGKAVSAEIEGQEWQYPVLPEKENEEVYRYLRRLRDRILNTGRVAHAKEFAWTIRVIKDDETINAFCAPGGYIYVFTGLLKFLDSEDELAGILAHEIAHAANRHSTRQMSRSMPLRRVADALLGKGEALKELAVGIASLKYSRQHEAEADDFAIQYLCGTGIRADGCKNFFLKLETLGELEPPEWLSSHPSSKGRIAHLEARAKALGCSGVQTNEREYRRIVALLKGE